ncbi:MAG: dihydrofolate reductase [Pseudomonadota bacterium]|nr:dihydrofolate reductase [Rhodocyclaceae bacterium]
MIVIIAAVAKNGVIGKENALPWRLPEDMAHFKALTLGHTVIMGRKTWESLPPKFRPLPNRRNVVVTRNVDYAAPGAEVVHSLDEAVKLGAGGTAFVIGGAELYAHALPLADRLELTEIDADIEGDAYFPALDRAEWREIGRVAGRSANGLAYAFVTYERTQST